MRDYEAKLIDEFKDNIESYNKMKENTVYYFEVLFFFKKFFNFFIKIIISFFL